MFNSISISKSNTTKDNNNNVSKNQDKQDNNKDFKLDAKEFSELSENDYCRFLPNSNKVGYAVIEKTKNGEVAKQYSLEGNHQDGPELKTMHNIKKVRLKNGLDVYFANTNKNNNNEISFKAKRFLKINVKDLVKNTSNDYTIAQFSPISKKEFWGSKAENINFFNANYLNKKSRNKSNKNNKIKGDLELTLNNEDVKAREKQTRNPSQNKVMGLSAAKYYAKYLKKAYKKLTETAIDKLDKASKATLGKNIRPEWLHIDSYTNMPLDLDPQTKNNLGASSKGNNTEMMVGEKIARFFTKNSKMTVKTKNNFEMIEQSHLVKNIHYEAKISDKKKEVTLTQDIPALQNYRNLCKASDKATGSHALFNIFKEKNKPIISKVDTSHIESLKKLKSKGQDQHQGKLIEKASLEEQNQKDHKPLFGVDNIIKGKPSSEFNFIFGSQAYSKYKKLDSDKKLIKKIEFDDSIPDEEFFSKDIDKAISNHLKRKRNYSCGKNKKFKSNN